MIILIAGTTHTGKTALAQRLLEKYKFPYLSLDHLKMGLIRSGKTDLSVCDDEKLTPYLWSIVKEIVKTAIENGQNLIIEGCYIPFDWQKDFEAEYRKEIKFFCLVLSQNYIEKHFEDIKKFANIIENRVGDDLKKSDVIAENAKYFSLCEKYGANYILIDNEYSFEIELDVP